MTHIVYCDFFDAQGDAVLALAHVTDAADPEYDMLKSAYIQLVSNINFGVVSYFDTKDFASVDTLNEAIAKLKIDRSSSLCYPIHIE